MNFKLQQYEMNIKNFMVAITKETLIMFWPLGLLGMDKG